MIIKLYNLFDKSYKYKFFYLISLTFFVALLEMLSMGLIIPIAYFFFNNQISDIYLVNIFFDFVNYLSNLFNVEDLIILFLLVFLTFLIKFMVLVYFVFFQSNFNANLQVLISGRLLKKFSEMSFSKYSIKNSSSLLRNVNNETGILTNNINLPIIQIISETLVIIGMICLLLLIDFSVTIITIVIFFSAGFFLLTLTKKKLVKAGKDRQEHDAKRINALNLIYGGFKELKVLNKVNYFISKYIQSNKFYTQSYRQQQALSQLPRLLLEIITISSIIILLIYMLNKDRTYVEVLTYLSIFAGCSFKVMPSANRILRSFQLIKFGKSSIDTITNFLTEKNEINDSESNFQNNFDNNFFLGIKKLEFYYINDAGEKKYILKDLDFEMGQNSSVGIIGESGSGKTTLFNLISGLDKPSSGNIFNFQENIHNDVTSWRSNIGYVPQEIFLFEGSIKKNIALSDDENISDEQVLKCLKLAQIDKFFLSKKDQLNTIIGERGINISGGQKQRVGIARALYNNPKLLILDEATSALNEEIEEEIMKSIYSLQKNLSIIIISHKNSILSKCNTIYKMKDGHLHKIN
jgi:ATP-binding cassette, subfamily B, bacterial PglK